MKGLPSFLKNGHFEVLHYSIAISILMQTKC